MEREEKFATIRTPGITSATFNVTFFSNTSFVFLSMGSQPCLEGVPLAEEDGGGGDEDERLGAGSEAVLELHVSLHQGEGHPLLAGLTLRVHQKPLTG